MNLLFDEKSQKLIVQAKKEMYELKHPYVGSEHLFLAILKDEDLEITKFLNKCGIFYFNFKEEIIKTIGVGNISNDWFLFTPMLRKIMNEAIYYSKDNNKVVTPNSLLISILKMGDGVANRILVCMGVDIESLYDNLVINSSSLKFGSKTMLDDLAINMNKNAENDKYDPVIGRDQEVNLLIQILLRKNKHNPLLIGEAGVGKTAIVEELSRRISNGNVPLKLKNKIIYSVSMSILVAGTKYRGEFEEKINKIIKEVIDNKDVILFIDEIHTLVGAGGAEGAIDASNIIKPYLARGDFQIIGATTNNEYTKSLKKDKALDRRFQKVYVFEPSNDDVVHIITKLKDVYENYHGIIIPLELINSIVKLSSMYLHYGKQPDKAIDLLDEACAYSSFVSNTYNEKIQAIEKEITKCENNKNREILNKSFKRALNYRKKELKLKSDYNQLMFSEKGKLENNVLELEHIYKIIYDKTGILMGDRLSKKVEAVRKYMKKQCFNKSHVIKSVFDFIENNYFLDNVSPLSFLFVGKSGVGKTFFVDEIAKNMCPADAFFKFDLSEYNGSMSINKLIGNVSTVNYDDNNTFLDNIRLHPFSIVLFENINLCSNEVYELLINMLSTGYLINSNSEKIYFSNTIIFFTITSSVNKFGFNYSSTNYNNQLFKNISKIIKFNDVSKNAIINQVKKQCDITDVNLDMFLRDVDYEHQGYKKLNNCIKKYFIDRELKS